MKRHILLIFSVITIFMFIFYLAFKEQVKITSSADYAHAKSLKQHRGFEAKAEEEKQEHRTDQPGLAMQWEVESRSTIGQPFSYQGSYRFQALHQVTAERSLARREILPWVERGPGNVGGRTRAISVHPDSQDVWLAGAVGGGIWKTENAGSSWRSVTDNLPILSVCAIARCDSQPNVVYAGTGEGFYNSDAIIGDGLFKSSDGGESWSQILSTVNVPDFSYVNRIIVDPNDPDLVLASTNSAIMRSTDGGDTWTSVFSNGSRVQQIIANPDNFSTQYAAVNGSGVYKSIDGGVNWNASSNFSVSFYRVEMALAPSDTSILYATLTNSGGGLAAFYRSDDAGNSWANLGSSPNWLGTQGWYDNTLVVSPADPNEIIVGGLNLYRITATSHGMSGQKITNWYGGTGYPYVHADQHILVAYPGTGGQYKLTVGNDGGVFYSTTSGASWSQRDDGYNVTQFYDADKHPVQTKFVGGTQDNGTNLSPIDATAASQWAQPVGGDGFECAWNKNDGNIVYASLYYSQVYKSTDSGTSFQGVAGLPGSSVFHTSLGMDPFDPDILLVVGNNNTVYRTNDGGDNWEAISGEFNGYNRKTFQFSTINPNIVWAASNASGINVSTDAGLHFHGVSTLPGASNSYILGIGIHPTLDSTAFVTLGVANHPKIYRTDDLGDTWMNITNNLPDVPVHSIISMPYNPDIIWAGTDIGLFESVDAGSTWNYAANGIPAAAIVKLKIVGQDVVAATHGRGVWSVHIDSLPPLVVPTLSPLLHHLEPALPNIPELTFHFSTRSNHDSIRVLVNDSLVANYGETTAYSDLSVLYMAHYGDTLTVDVVGYTDGLTYASEPRTIPVFAPVEQLTDSFDSVSTIISNDLNIGPASSFSSNILQTIHPYSSNKNYYAYIGNPIIISSQTMLDYSDVALVEPGDPGTQYPDQAMWDFCTVEGSLDGSNWSILVEPYDSRYDNSWLDAYNSNFDGFQTLMREHSINLNDYYAAGDTVRVRFRLFSDEYVTGWGWGIDNLVLSNGTGTAPGAFIPRTFALLPNYPNPFNASTNLRFMLDLTGPVDLTIYDLQGRVVNRLITQRLFPAGHIQQIPWNGKNDLGQNVATGIYYARLASRQQQAVIKLTLLK